ncbi:hypothetical protein HHI36_014601 [Cryptolaemus montrouzieri]|uniref:Uncharacterized protein n=1 Tax=Cryptolaemus montrouzieri TaxID=559131 RepID=A0ABD2N3Z1_9CUCU
MEEGIEIAELTRDLFELTLTHGERDFIIFMFDTYNISNSNNLNRIMKYLFPTGKTTNLIIMGNQTIAGDYRIAQRMHDGLKAFRKCNYNCSIEIKINTEKSSKLSICRSIRDMILLVSKSTTIFNVRCINP